MSRMPLAPAEAQNPEALLRKATLARTSGMRAKYAKRGLSQDGTVDRTTRAMLLRQLYLSRMESRLFREALQIAEDMVALAIMPDVARQDAARACIGLGDSAGAIEHLRLASRVSPPSRRAFHLWTLGSTLYLMGRASDAIGPLSRAARWGTIDKPLYLGQLTLARLACGETVEGLGAVRELLADAPCGQGYGQFVLGELAFADGDFKAATEYLLAFVRRTGGGRVALQVALQGELKQAKRLISRARNKLRRAAPEGA
jgi:tetratricopeptide (TPR) repeat protein